MTLPRIHGYAAVFHDIGNSAKYGAERIKPGSFASALSRTDNVIATVNHLDSLELGSTRSRTLKLWEDSDGLRFTLQPPNNDLGRMLCGSIWSGAFRHLSFRFVDCTHQHDATLGVSVLSDFGALVDISFVDNPAYRGTVCQLERIPAVDVRCCVTRLHETIREHSRGRLQEAY